MSRKVEITVGLFMVLVICSVLFLCFKVTDTTSFSNKSTYRVHAIFDNIGGLKTRSPIKIGGVVVGRIGDITLKDYKPYVALDINSNFDKIPASSSLSIKTSGLLGEQYVDISLGIERSFENELDEMDALDNGITTTNNAKNQTPEFFEEGLVISNTKPAIVIEDLIGQFMYSMNSSDSKTDSNKSN
ncbi:outer membrane lipid asymmetry maintenance protein MlaD [Orbaceae bacterium ac157xtp]